MKDEADNQLCSDLMDFLRARFAPRIGAFAGNFSLKGRTLGSVVTLCNEWHVDIYNRDLEKKFVNTEFPPSGVKDWNHETKFYIPWSICQVRNVKELKAEGTKMKHCVLSYTHECSRGATYIFSVKQHGNRMITLEVRPRGNGVLIITQARGRFNRTMHNDERRIVSMWARENNIQIGDYV